MEVLGSKFSSDGALKKAVPMVFMTVSICVQAFLTGEKTVGPIRTGEAPFDAPERRKDDGDTRGVIGIIWYVPHAAL